MALAIAISSGLSYCIESLPLVQQTRHVHWKQKMLHSHSTRILEYAVRDKLLIVSMQYTEYEEDVTLPLARAFRTTLRRQSRIGLWEQDLSGASLGKQLQSSVF